MRDQREAKGWSQTEFAKRLSDRGLPFHQTTVQRIENGRRPLKLAEALVIAEVLETKFETMLRAISVTMAYQELSNHVRPGAFDFIVREADDLVWRLDHDTTSELVKYYQDAVEQTPGVELEQRLIDVANEFIRLKKELHQEAHALGRSVKFAERLFNELPRDYPTRYYDEDDSDT